MKRDHMPLSDEEDRCTKTRVVGQQSPGTRKMITSLEKEVESLQQETNCQKATAKKAENDSKQKQKELDKAMEEILNWVPEAIHDAHNRRDSMYHLLRQTSVELMNCQRKLKMPLTGIPTEDKTGAHENDDHNDSNRDTSDISVLLADELIKAKKAHKEEIACLQEEIASLRYELTELKAKHANCNHDSCPQHTKVSNESFTIMHLPLVHGPIPLLTLPREAHNASWFKDAFQFLNLNLGAPYTALINRWIELERLNNWQTVTTGLTNVN
ncbi:hypothetical protein GYMLUDRAFT_250930 [Collybiopsis luxurians FD-317 M1]|uniref:Uncharacterized protein n=1 Tax=Collybiopsis luxurians FD-317 M1 TaxID=944289 RepID=A0A0D0BDX5_9AGAR|nr:hypothetical protein GYMLUDRAFT_250930 [Collybiopsis luxurians FD-317 M1]